MKSLKRCLVVLFASFLFVTSTLTVNVLAEETEEVQMTDAISEVNPLYEGEITEEELPEPDLSETPQQLNAESDSFNSVESAAAFLRKGMVERQSSIVFRLELAVSSREDGLNKINQAMRSIFDTAIEHTGNPKEGDYLRWQYQRWQVPSTSVYFTGSSSYAVLTYNMQYYTSASQEAELDSAVMDLLNNLDLAGKTDYQKVKAIYDYMCANIVYDNENLENEEYKLKYTAYAALINKTAVCQGYANLLYRLLLEQGIDVRLVAGDAGGRHSWNIIRLNGLYYNVDSTWDAGETEYTYFLRCPSNFPNHTRDDEYDTLAFHEIYPMAEQDYSEEDANKNYIYQEMEWVAGNEPSVRAVYVNENNPGDVRYVNADLNEVETISETCTENRFVNYEAVVPFTRSLDYQEHRESLVYEVENTALGHDYYSNWHWSPDYQSAFVTLTCNHCGDQKELTATVTSEPGEDDTTVFTATAVDGETGTEYTSGVTVVNSETPVIRDIYVDSALSTEVSSYDQHDYYRFTPEESGLYCLEVVSEEANVSFNFYASDKKSDYVSHLSNSYLNEYKLNVIYSFTAGNTYVINVGSYFSGSSYQITMKQFPETESVSVGDVRIFDDQYYLDEYWVDDTRHTYKRYNYNFNSLELIMEDGNTFSGSYSDVENEFLNAYGMQLLINGPTDDQSYENQWTLGTHEAHVEINGIDCLFHVTVVLSPIQSVEASDRHVFSGDGYTTTEWDQEIQAEVEYFVYYTDPRSITVHTDNGDYTGDQWSVQQQIYDAYGVSYGVSILGNDQSSKNQWAVGTSHEMTFMFGSHAAPYTIYVEADPVVSVTIADMSVNEDQGSWSKETAAGETRYVFYNQIIPQNITVEMSDGEVKTFETETEMQNYLSDKYNRGYSINLTDNYKDLSAGTHVVSFTVGAYNGTFNLEVLPSQITSVTVNGPVTVYDGQQVTGYDYSTGEEIRYQYYSPEPRDITVVVQGEEITGSVDRVWETLNSQYGISAEYFIETEQSPTVVWETGNTYTATLHFGRKSIDYEVKVEPDLITEVTVRDTTAIEGTGHSIGEDFLVYSDTPYVTLKTADQTFEGPMYQVSSQFYDVYGYTPSIEWNLRDLQIADGGWHVGETHTVAFKIGTAETTYLFTIIENPISSFMIDPIRIIIGTGYTNYDADDQPYMHYNIDPVSGTVVLKNGDILSGTISEISEELSRRYGGAEFQLYSADDQYNNHWTEPGTYTVEFYWSGVSSNVIVNLIADLISSITAEGYTYFLGDTTTFYNGDSSHEGYQYVPKMVTVTMVDGASFTGETGKVTDWLAENYDYHVNVYFDTEIPSSEWAEPGDYKCFVHYGNVTGEYYTHVIANPIEDMIINDTPIVKMLGDIQNGLYENGHSYNGYSVMPTSITLIFNDGHETLNGYPYDLVRQLISEYNVSLSYPQLTTGQYETPWETAGKYTASLKIGPMTREFQVIIKESIFEWITVEDMVYYEGDQTTANWDGVRFRMYPVYPNEITVKMKDKEEPYTGATYQVLQQISTDYGLGDLYLSVRHDQTPDNVWAPGNYEVSVSLEGVTTTMNVEIRESPVASVEVDDIKVIYGKKLLRRYDQATDTQYNVYNTNPVNVRVTLKSGEVLSGQLYRVQNELSRRYDEHQFRAVIDDDGQTVDSEEWELGSVHEISAYVFGVYTTYQCEVIDHPILSVSFDDFTIKEGNGYTETDENGNQYIRYYSTPKHVIIETYDGKIHEADSIFDLGQIMETDYSLPFDYPIVEDGQSYETPWVLGGTYDVTATAYDKSGSYKVTIVENPIRSIEAEDFSLVFGDKTDNRVDSTGYSFYECYNTTPLRIKVTMNDGRVLEGSFEEVQKTLMEEYFDNEYVYYDVYDDQAKETEWQLGEHEVQIRMGTCTDTYKVNIVTGDFLMGLSCSDYSVIEGAKKDIESLDRRDGMKIYYTVFGYDADDTTVTVTVNGQPFTGTPEEVTAYLKEEYSLSVSCEFYDGQGRESWGVGEHTVTMGMAGLQTTYKVNVIPNPIKSLSTNDVEIEASDYEMDGSGAFRVYHFDSDSVIAELENETIQGTEEVISSELSEIAGADILIDYVSGQSLEHPWHPGNDYPAYVIAFSHGAEFMRYEYTVTILSNYEVVKWNWAEDGSSASVTLRQKNTGDVLDVDAEVTLKTEAPTCTADGKLIYTAYVLYDNEEFTDTLILKGEDALGHDCGEVSYEWIETEEGYDVHASATCARCEEVLDETVTAVYSVAKEATCTEDGTGLYTAKFTNNVFKTQTKETVIEALGHHYVFKGFEWSENSLNAYGLFECERGDVDVIRVVAIVTETVREPATCETDGYITYTASLNVDECPDHMAHEGENTIVLEKLGHEWTFRNITWTKTDFGYEAEANYVCAHDSAHTNVVEADVTEKRTLATCEADGSVVYTAAVSEEDSLDSQTHSDEKTEVLEALGHDYGDWTQVKAPTCTEEGTERRICKNDVSHVEERSVPALGHDYGEPVWNWSDDLASANAVFNCKRDNSHTEEVKAEVTVTEEEDKFLYTAKVSFNGKEYTDTKEVNKEAPPVEEGSVIRLSGRLRYDTSLVVADELKSVLGIDKFDTVILATGEEFADALGGGYLAAKKSAPIILTKPTQKDKVNKYINENLKDNGTVYVLGGEGAVPASCLEGLNTSNIVRLSGRNRYVTNLAILNEAGVDREDILIVTGTNYADSLAASATGLPMLLVNGKNTSLNDGQRSFLSTHSSNTFYIIGGTGAVSSDIETDISSISSVNRLSGKLRFDTSVLIAETFFSDPDKVILSYSHNFPDGLSGGPLAYALHSPVLLTRENSEKAALDYVSSHSITSGYLCGGDKVLPDTTARIIFSLPEDQEIEKR